MGGDPLEFKTIEQDDGTVTVTTPEPLRQFTKEEFQSGAAIAELYRRFGDNPIGLAIAKSDLRGQAKAIGIVGFAEILKAADQAQRYDLLTVQNTTEEFEYNGSTLCCGSWECSPYGVSRITLKGREVACPHPILPVERLINIDSKVVQYRLAFMRSRTSKRWESVIVNASTISKAREITALSEMNISVTSTTASSLVDFLNDVCNLNYDIIPETKSIGRLGYIPEHGFMPFVDGVTFDGDASFKNLYGCVKSKGSVITWCDIAEECRKMSVTARILLAASFASPILSIVGSLPFFVHLWGVDSGTGKTVALMLAASVWGDPALGSYVQTFNSTQVGQERTAAFLNHLPFCIDELQLTKDSKGRLNFDVYQLAQGVGRARGRKNGGIDAAPTWNCCFLTTGESPIVSGSAGAGAVNRVIDIECTAGSAVITEGQRIANALKQNYGHVGRTFVEKIYSSDEWLDTIRDLYQDFYKELCSGDSTEKQAMAAAAILTADTVATQLFFKDGMALTVKDIRDFLASKEAVSAGNRAYNWLCDWVSSNANHFITDQNAAQGEIYGVLEGDMAYIIRGVFDRVIQEAGFNGKAILSYLYKNRLIEVRTKNGKPNGFTQTKSIGGTKPQCIWLRLNGANTSYNYDEEDMLPL